MEEILKKEAIIDLEAKCGLSALDLAAANGHTRIVELLLASDPHADKSAAVIFAAEYGHDDIVAILMPGAATETLHEALAKRAAGSCTDRGSPPRPQTRLARHGF